MSILGELPDWDAPSNKIIEPDITKKTSGWNPGERPPAYYFNWMWNMVSNALETLSNHLHDDRYSKKDHTHSVTEVSGKIDNAAYADNADKLDGRDASDFASSSHSHPYSPENHTHDGRYYKKSEIDSKIQQSVASNEDLVESIYPVGSIYINATNNTNPGTLLGFGTWERFGEGRVLVSQDSTDSDFNGIGETGGEKEHQLTESEMPSHNHNYTRVSGGYGGGGLNVDGSTSTVPTSLAGGDQPHNNLQPYITVYMWKRIS